MNRSVTKHIPAPTHFIPACAAKLLALLLLLTVSGMAQAQEFTWTQNNDTITITGYTGSGGAVIIPDTINGLPVVSIGFEAFFECRSLTSVTLPKGLNDLQTYAFRGCSSLAALTIPSNVTSIANSAFYDSGLTNINIPASVMSIGNTAFNPCPKLKAITVDPLNVVYSSVDGVLLNKSQTSLIQYPGGKSGSYSMPDSVTSIGNSAFSYCGDLTSVTISTNATTIGNAAFFTCPKMTSITLPDRVASIGSAIFAYCRGLTNITIGKSVASIGIRAFATCTSLGAITVDNLNSSFTSVDGVLFNKSQTTLVAYPGGKIGSYTIPSVVKGIGSYAFESNTYLTGVVIPSSVTIIPAYAFASCTNLTSITIPKGVTTVGDRAFVNCRGLTAVYFCGNSPWLGSSYVFYSANQATIYYLSGTTGWTTTYGDRPTVLWDPQPQTRDPSFGVRANRFGFNITGSSNLTVVVEACANLANPTWTPVSTNALTEGSSYFSDPQWTNSPGRFYRLRP